MKADAQKTSLPPLVKVEEVTRIYRTATHEVAALRGVNLELPRGVLAALKGRSGSGKTTLLNMIGGLDKPSSGQITLDGQLLSGLSEHELTQLRRHHIGFVFQSFALMPNYTATENLDMMLRLIGTGRKERIERVRRCLHGVGLSRWMDHRPGEMSGGQQQRLAVARAIATHPDLILADEPTGELDTTATRQIFSLFRSLVDKEGLTILLTTHNPIVDEYADTAFKLVDGVIEK